MIPFFFFLRSQNSLLWPACDESLEVCIHPLIHHPLQGKRWTFLRLILIQSIEDQVYGANFMQDTTNGSFELIVRRTPNLNVGSDMSQTHVLHVCATAISNLAEQLIQQRWVDILQRLHVLTHFRVKEKPHHKSLFIADEPVPPIQQRSVDELSLVSLE